MAKPGSESPERQFVTLETSLKFYVRTPEEKKNSKSGKRKVFRTCKTLRQCTRGTLISRAGLPRASLTRAPPFLVSLTGECSLLTLLKENCRGERLEGTWWPIIASDKFAHGHSPTLVHSIHVHIKVYKSTQGLGGLSVFLNIFPPPFSSLYIFYFLQSFVPVQYFLYVLRTRTSQRKETAVRFAREDPQLGNRSTG